MSIQVKNVSKSFKTSTKEVDALIDINLDIPTGELICILGPSGCVKTTLLRLIAGLDELSSGEILENNEIIKGPSEDRGFVFQQYSLFPWLNVLDNVMFGLKFKDTSKEEDLRRTKKYLEAVGLDNFEKTYPHELSGGMKQRVAIIRTLVNKSNILLMDEPFSALDMQNRHKLQEELIRIWKKTKKTIIFVTHDVDEAVFLSNRVVIMSKSPGKIKEIFKVDLNYPRIRDSTEFLKIQKQIIDILDDDEDI